MLIDSTIKLDPTIDLIQHTATVLESDYSLRVNDNAHRITTDQLKALMADARYAADDWFSHFTNKGKIDIEINIAKLTPDHPANGKPGIYVPDHTETIDTVNGPFNIHQVWNVQQAGTLIEMKTGVDPNGEAPDMIINIDPDFLKGAFLAPDPNFQEHSHDTRGVPRNDQADMINFLLHEMGHGFGIGSDRNTDTGDLPRQVTPGLISYTETTFDKFIEIHSDGSAWFTGANAEQVYGGPVPVTTLKNGEQYEHFGNESVWNRYDAAHDVMSGVGIANGYRYDITDLDIAVMKDIGAPVPVPVPLTLVSDTSLIGTHNHASDAIHNLFA